MRRKQHPLHVAFTFTTLGAVLLVSGATGYTVKNSNWSFLTATWSDSVVWWEIAYGAAALMLAAFFWRKGLRETPHAPSGT